MKYDIESIMNRKKTVQRIRIVLIVIFIIILYNVILVGISSIDNEESLNLFGYQAYIITSNSMEPEINNGDVVIVRQCKEEDLNINDIITFDKDGRINTHRITNIINEEGKVKYITKGDNNSIEDQEKIEFSNIKGKMTIKIPYLGNVIMFLQNQMIILIFLLLYHYILDKNHFSKYLLQIMLQNNNYFFHIHR